MMMVASGRSGAASTSTPRTSSAYRKGAARAVGVRRAPPVAAVTARDAPAARSRGTLAIRASGPGYGKTTLDTSRVVQFQRNEKDTGSPEAQIALFTCRIKQLTDHLKANRKDHQCSRGLQIVLGKRKKMLEYLYRQDKDKYVDVCESLGIRQTIKITPRPR